MFIGQCDKCAIAAYNDSEVVKKDIQTPWLLIME